ncbi:PAS domain S-box protein [Gloeocapsopsis dulcis]|nr:PAS domain S-box protein [Gloeocapsopsis dulcis]WNN87680.1 PAS domain S-box protein [Gloeocapsopsis dulcis]
MSDGEMGALMRSHDWSQTPLGAVENWSQSLRASLSILLVSSCPMYLAWGKNLIQFYNDAYCPFLGSTKHPTALGQSASECFSQMWDSIGSIFEQVMVEGKAAALENQQFLLDRNGSVEECYFTFSYSPIPDEGNQVGGVLVTVIETTQRVLNKQKSPIQQAVNAAIQRSEERSQLAIQIAQLGTWIYNPNTNLVELDERMREIWGESENIVVLPLSQVIERIHADDREQVASTVKAALDPGSSGVYEVDYRIVWDDGTQRWVSANGQATFTGEGLRQAVEFLGTALDITDREQAERMLIEQKQLLELIASGQPLDECLAAVCASVTRLNSARACLLLTNAQRLTPHFITPDFPPSFGQALKDAPINDLCFGTCGEAVYRNEPITCADIANDDRWSQEWRDICIAHGILACHFKPVIGIDGLPFGLLMLCFSEARMPTDWEYQLAEFGTRIANIVFERERSSLALRESEAEYRTLFESIDEGFCICEMLFDENGDPTDYRFLKVNSVFERQTGLKQAVGKTARQLIPDLEAFWFEMYGSVVQTGESVRFENQSIAMNRWFDVNAFRIGEPQSHQFAILFTNISARKWMELNREFLATISQDLIKAASIGEIVATVGAGLHRYFHVSVCAFVEINQRADEAVVKYDWHQGDRPSLIGVYSLPEFVTDELLQVAKAGHPVVIRDYAVDPRITDPSRYAALNIGAEINIPLIRNGEWQFSLTMIHQQPYDWRDDEIELLQELASRLWAKLERAHAEAALSESRAELERQVQKFDATLSTITDSVFSFDRDGQFLYANQVLLDLWGRTAAEAIGKTLAELNYPEAVEQQLMNNTRRVFETGETIKDETAYTNPAGVDGYFEYILSPVFAADGTIESVVGSSRNISDRKSAEEALRRSEEQSRNILESIADAFFAVDENWRFSYVNQTAYRLVNRTPGDLIGKIFWEEFLGVNNSEFEQMHRRVMRDRVADSLTAFYPDHDRWYEVRTYPAASGITIYFRNVTDQIQAEVALRESEARLRFMLDASQIGDWDLDLTTEPHTAHRSLRHDQIFGYESLLPEWSYEIFLGHVHPDDRAAVNEKFQQTLSTSTNWNFECRIIHPDRSIHWIWVRSSVYSDSSDVPTRLLGMVIDITERKSAEEALHQSEARFQLLYDTTSNLLATEQPLTLMHNLFNGLATQLGLDYYYNYMMEEKDNRPMLHLRNYGEISDEVAQSIEWIEVGQYLCGLVAQRRQQIVLNQAQISNHPNAQLICSTGVTAYAGQPLIVQGRLLGTLSFASRTRTGFTPEEIDLLQSVCDQMAFALERTNLINSIQQQAEQLQRANQIKDEFLAVLSHELRSPLNPILGWTRLLQNGKLDAARQAEALKTIERNAKLQTQLIEDLLDISCIMQGKLSLTAAPVSLSFVISAAVETVRLAAEAKNIQIALDLDSEIALIYGDAARLQQVMWNLLANAVKFTPNSRQVTVELRQLDQVAQIRVIDTGKGINPQFLPHVFEYFRQEDGSTTRKFGGLGLGLAIVRQIVEMHGGTVRAESQGENQGATFIVQLPVMQQATLIASEPIHTQAAAEVLLDGVQILLVDDETDTREFQAFLLEQSGANVTAVASGLEALQALEQFIPDVLVSDIGMAKMDGYMLIQQIRSRSPNQGGTIPAIALTAYAAEIDQQRALQVGFQTHITKPVEPEELVRAIANLQKI